MTRSYGCVPERRPYLPSLIHNQRGRLLTNTDRLILPHRDTFAQDLCSDLELLAGRNLWMRFYWGLLCRSGLSVAMAIRNLPGASGSMDCHHRLRVPSVERSSSNCHMTRFDRSVLRGTDLSYH